MHGLMDETNQTPSILSYPKNLYVYFFLFFTLLKKKKEQKMCVALPLTVYPTTIINFSALRSRFCTQHNPIHEWRRKKRNSPQRRPRLIIITIITAVTVASALGGGRAVQAIPRRVITVPDFP